MCRWQGKKCKVWFQNSPACGQWKHWRDKVNYDRLIVTTNIKSGSYGFQSSLFLNKYKRVTLFINVNPRFTFPFRQTKIIPYLFHFTKRDSKGILFYWMIAVSLIGLNFSEKNFLIICKRKTHFIPLNSLKLV